ncbi:hypothetical protein GWI33_019180 [Rhynchophorus ferrugineus]|uniref:Uncharacterized protein n=1 Tax=Rhynchophorus ferrugineus TaxID=354439 RepID=A0A834HS27_RHYFE|nr:hypothetical protein GWI33_019180 [Rhynchophorus ferrugineus]
MSTKDEQPIVAPHTDKGCIDNQTKADPIESNFYRCPSEVLIAETIERARQWRRKMDKNQRQEARISSCVTLGRKWRQSKRRRSSLILG